MFKFFFSLLIGSLFLASSSLCSVETTSTLIHTLSSEVLETIRHSKTIPGFQSEEFSTLKGEICSTWSNLVREGALEVYATDKEVRPLFVAIQGVVEHVLASELQNSVSSLKGVIHTPMPTTPLCTAGELSEGLVDPSIETDPARSFTVKARAVVLRKYLEKGGDLYVVYPKGGLEKRTQQQQQVYKQELLNYPEHLFDTPLDCATLPADLIGATYLFQDSFGEMFVFAIKMSQAKDPQGAGHFGLWFGPACHPSIQKRVEAVFDCMGQVLP